MLPLYYREIPAMIKVTYKDQSIVSILNFDENLRGIPVQYNLGKIEKNVIEGKISYDY